MAALASEGLRDSDAYIALKNGDILIQTWEQENAHKYVAKTSRLFSVSLSKYVATNHMTICVLKERAPWNNFNIE